MPAQEKELESEVSLFGTELAHFPIVVVVVVVMFCTSQSGKSLW